MKSELSVSLSRSRSPSSRASAIVTSELTHPLHDTAFFLLTSLEATSAFLAELLEPQVEAYETALETDPLAELDDFMTFKNLPDSTKVKLDERQELVKRVWRVSFRTLSHLYATLTCSSVETGWREVDKMVRANEQG
jgi:hypothetical protein